MRGRFGNGMQRVGLRSRFWHASARQRLCARAWQWVSRSLDKHLPHIYSAVAIATATTIAIATIIAIR
eukprot:4018235-Lingulodinium_polyedra.AAC.1